MNPLDGLSALPYYAPSNIHCMFFGRFPEPIMARLDSKTNSNSNLNLLKNQAFVIINQKQSLSLGFLAVYVYTGIP